MPDSDAASSAARAPVASVSSSNASRAWPRRPTALRRGASRNPTASQSTLSESSRDAWISAARPGRRVRANWFSPCRTITRFSSSSGTTSAIEPSAARPSISISVSRHSGVTFSEPACSVHRRHASLYATPAPHSSPNGYDESGRRGCTTA